MARMATLEGKRPPSERGVLVEGALVRTLRSELGLTQSDLAEIAGVTTRTVQSAEAASRVALFTLRQLSRALGVPMTRLVRTSARALQRRLAESGYGPLPGPQPWLGREREVGTLLEAVSSPPGMCCVAGASGLGKTALVRHAVSGLQHDEDLEVVWVRCSQLDPDRALCCQSEIAAELGFGDRLPDLEVVGRQAFDRVFRLWFWRRSRLLVLDDVVDSAQLGHFFGVERTGSVIVTTALRAVAEGIGGAVIELRPLPVGVARDLLAAELGAPRVGRDLVDATRLVEALGAAPRDLQIAIRTLRRERFSSLGSYLERLETGAAHHGPANSDTGLGVAVAPERSYAAAGARLRQQLDERSWCLLGRLSVRGTLPFSEDWAAEQGGLEPVEARRLLAELVSHYLLVDLAAAGQATGSTQARFALEPHCLHTARWIATREAADPVSHVTTI